MNLSDPSMRLLAASGGDTVKLFDVSDDSGDPCTLSYTPSPGCQVNCVKWNHTNLVVASAGDDKKISLWRKNGQSLGSIAGSDVVDNIEESISTISFSNKGSRYICSGGSGQVVRIWDLQRKRCIKWLRGHTDTITGAMYNCKDEHLASISLNGDLILHNLASGGRATELKDPNQQVLRVLDYSRVSRHLLVTAGDDGSVHLWDTTGRSPKVSWLKQHSAPTAGVSFSPSNDKVIASVGLDKKLYTFDTGTRRPSFCIPYEAPFSSVAFRDDGHILAAGTSGGRVVFYDVRAKPLPLTVLRAYGNSEAVVSLSWQRSKPVIVNENNCTSETALLGGGAEDSILMPDPLPSAPSSTSTPPSSQINPSRSSSYTDSFSFPSGSLSTSFSADETTPIRSSLWSGANLSRLHAPRSYDMKDDMDVFSPLVEVQPITPSLDKLWDEIGGTKKDFEKKPSLLFPSSRTFSLPEDITGKDSHPILDWKSNLSPKQDDTSSFKSEDSSAITPPEEWGGGRLSDKYTLNRQSINLPPRFANLTSTGLSTGSMVSGYQDMTMTTSSIPSFTNMRSKDNTSLNVDPSLGFPEHVPLTSSLSLGTSLNYPRRYSSYVERISTNPSFSDGTSLPAASPKTTKTGAEIREELLNSPISRSDVSTTADPVILPSLNVVPRTPTAAAAASQIDSQQGTSFMLQLFQRTLEETLGSFQKSVHEDIRNLHIEVLRQFHMHELETSKVMGPLVENVEELRNEVQSLRNEVQQLRQSLLH